MFRIRESSWSLRNHKNHRYVITYMINRSKYVNISCVNFDLKINDCVEKKAFTYRGQILLFLSLVRRVKSFNQIYFKNLGQSRHLLFSIFFLIARNILDIRPKILNYIFIT